MARYDALVAAGELKPDPDQQNAARALAALQGQLEASDEGGFLGKLFGRKPASPRGIYLWGGVGRGKSMLMDLFVETLAIPDKRRVHFHAFMLEVDGLIRVVAAAADKEVDWVPVELAELGEGFLRLGRADLSGRDDQRPPRRLERPGAG